MEVHKKGSRTTLIFLIALAAVVIIAGSEIFSMNSTINQKSSQINELQVNNSNLDDTMQSLNETLHAQNTTIQSQESQMQALNENYSALAINYSSLSIEYASALNSSTTYSNIANLNMSQIFANSSIAYSDGNVAPYGQVVSYSIPYAGFLQITFSSTDPTYVIISPASITASYWSNDLQDADSIVYPAFSNLHTSDYLGGTFEVPVMPGTVYILFANNDTDTATIHYSITYDY